MNDFKSENFEIRSDVEKLAPAIIDIMNVAKSNGVTCWLNYGALLGMVRENRLLPWNNDAQLCCWYEEDISIKFKNMTNQLNNMGYHSFYYSSIGAISSRKKGVAVYITCYWKEDDFAIRPHEVPSEIGYSTRTARAFYWLSTLTGAYTNATLKNISKQFDKNIMVKLLVSKLFRIMPLTTRKSMFKTFLNISINFGGVYQKTAIPKKYFKDFQYISFYGEEVLVPKNPESLLQFIYGNKWNIPKENWSFYSKENKEATGIIFIDEIFNYVFDDFI